MIYSTIFYTLYNVPLYIYDCLDNSYVYTLKTTRNTILTKGLCPDACVSSSFLAHFDIYLVGVQSVCTIFMFFFFFFFSMFVFISAWTHVFMCYDLPIIIIRVKNREFIERGMNERRKRKHSLKRKKKKKNNTTLIHTKKREKNENGSRVR